MLIIGGLTESGFTDTVLKYDSSNLNNDPLQMESMLYVRGNHACTIYNSALHDGRAIAIIAGGDSSKAEIWDFTKDGTSWQQSNIIFASIIFLFLYL